MYPANVQSGKIKIYIYRSYFKNNRMKTILPFLFFLLVSITTYAQNVFHIRAFLYPVGLQLGQSHLVEYGEGYYPFRYSKQNNWELGLMTDKNLFGDIYLELGMSLKKWNMEFDYIIIEPLSGGEVYKDESRYLRRLMISPHAGFAYKRNKLSLSAGVEPNIALSTSSNVETGELPRESFFNPATGNSAYLIIEETNYFYDDLFYNMTPSVTMEYKVTERLAVVANAKIRYFGTQPLYRLQITGTTGTPPNIEHKFNDTIILNRMMFLYFGASYTL